MSEQTRIETLAQYAEGWTKGDVDLICSTLQDSFLYEDRNSPRPIQGKTAFREAFARLYQYKDREKRKSQPFMELSEGMTKDDGTTLTAWCWWVLTYSPMKGSGLIKVTEEGVLSEKIAYY